MARTYTENYNLAKDDDNDFYDIEMHAENMETVDQIMKGLETKQTASLKFPKSSGTSTALVVVTGTFNLIDGQSFTFIPHASSSSGLKTINADSKGAKPLYKPLTSESPKTTSGKPITVWYDEANDCFFLKASAEGTAQAHHVLAPYTISNDDDTGIEGTMVGRGSIEVTPSDAVQNFDDGYYVGITVLPRPTLAGDADAAHVLAGKKFYSNNYTVKTGTMVDRAGDTAAASLTRSGTTIKLRATAGFRDGTNDNVTHTDANDVAANIKQGIAIRGVIGTLAASAYATGTKLVNTTAPFTYEGGGSPFETYAHAMTVTGLSFTPKIVHVFGVGTYYTVRNFYSEDRAVTCIYSNGNSNYSGAVYLYGRSFQLVPGGFTVPVGGEGTFTWKAYA